MGFQTLYRAKAFGSGADLWVVPEPEESEISSRIDWYLNFQIAKSKVHKKKEIGNQLEESIRKHSLRLPKVPNSSEAPLLLASEQRFPNRMVVEVKSKPAKDWILEVENLWSKLDRPRLRVFLPKELTPEKFQTLWQSALGPSDEITLVPA